MCNLQKLDNCFFTSSLVPRPFNHQRNRDNLLSVKLLLLLLLLAPILITKAD
jgi:hypothetical protein